MDIEEDLFTTVVKCYRVTSSWFVAGFCTHADLITVTAPILRQFRGWDLCKFKTAARHSGWGIEELSQPPADVEVIL